MRGSGFTLQAKGHSLRSAGLLLSVNSSEYIHGSFGVVSGLLGAFYSICCLGFVAIFELRTIENNIADK